MRSVGEEGTRIISSKLLRRLESKGLISEPPVEARPLLPSARRWGGKRGYCYVTKKLDANTFSFEGVSYRFVVEDKLTYIYKINENLSNY